MALRHGLFVSGASAGVTAPQDGRLALAGLLSGPGMLTGGAVTGSTSGPNMKYTIAAGVFVTQRGTLAADGLYIVPNDGAVTVDSGSPAPGSGTRWDLIWVRQLNAYGSDGFGDANSDPVFGVTVGTAGSTPTKPYASVPAGALVLAESNVGTSIANASLATITLVAPLTWQNTVAPRFQYHQGTVQNTSNGNQLIVNNLVKDVDTVGGFNAATGVWTVPTGMGGRWEMSALGSYSNGSVVSFNLGLWVGGIAGTPKVAIRKTADASGVTSLIIPTLEIVFADGDQVSLQVFANGGGGTSSISSFATLWRGKKIT